MTARKQQLLRRYRQRKRIAAALVIVALVALGFWLGPATLLVALLLAWLAHEAWFADHLFYDPAEDYRHRFPADTRRVDFELRDGRLTVPDGFTLDDPQRDTLILRVTLRSTWLGHLFDPFVRLGADRQDFERGARGARHLNLTGQGAAWLAGGLALEARFCRLDAAAQLCVFAAPDLARKRLLILAPHADDAELAAFGLYSEMEDVAIVTITQGETEARAYRRFGLSAAAAAQLKGRLRAWDSRAIPQWGGVPPSRCLQLGYFCMRLAAMRENPQDAFASLESGEADTRPARRGNALALPGDRDGVPSWRNLVADLAHCLEHFRADYVILPHPELDPHPDHVACARAFAEALRQARWQPEGLLLYANHLHDNDRWPLGAAHQGVALPPALTDLPADALYSHVLDAPRRLDKAMALCMEHDLRTRLPFKKRLRRQIQHLLLGRRWPAYGENEYLRKAVRRHELFWLRAPEALAASFAPSSPIEVTAATEARAVL